MPRQARIDIPGLLQHVIVRGIERRNIFRDNTDRKFFVQRFSDLLVETETDCFAWALIPNHFHILLRPRRCQLKQFMRRLLTGYAINFNRRHHRAGHVFQNRYKSIVCEEETYLLELVRYIYLNPLRAKIVADIESLNKYQWCGHAVLMEMRAFEGMVTEEFLTRFGDSNSIARSSYLNFINDGISQGQKPELVGGGLKRSLGGILPKERDPFEAYDERVLGSGAFVEQLRQKHKLKDNLISGMEIPELMGRIEKHFGIAPGELGQRRRNKQVVKARDVFCYIAVRILSHSGTKAGQFMNIKRSAVSHAVERGRQIVAEKPNLVEKIIQPPC